MRDTACTPQALGSEALQGLRLARTTGQAFTLCLSPLRFQPSHSCTGKTSPGLCTHLTAGGCLPS